MSDDPDQPKNVGSDMHAKKWSEYGGHGKYTSSDEDDRLASINSSTYFPSGLSPSRYSKGYQPSDNDGRNEDDHSPKLTKFNLLKKILIGIAFGIITIALFLSPPVLFP